MYVGAKGEEGGRGNRWSNYARNGGWVFFFSSLQKGAGVKERKEVSCLQM